MEATTNILYETRPGASENSPLAAEWTKLMMWLFLISDAITFGGLLCGYAALRMGSTNWPVPAKIFNINLVAFMTFILICSSVSMVKALSAVRHDSLVFMFRNKPVSLGMLLWLLATIAGGLIFLGCQAYEWNKLIHEGMHLDRNPWGNPGFGMTFFITTGFHGLHVTGGVILLSIGALQGLLGRYTADNNDGIEMIGLYWHFVDLVWILIFTFLYLI